MKKNNAKQVSSFNWFKKHKDCKLEIRQTNILGLTDYRCKEHGCGLVTSKKPGDPEVKADPFGFKNLP